MIFPANVYENAPSRTAKSAHSGVICTTGFTEAELLSESDFVSHNKLGVVYAPNVTLA
jgi:dihydrodipicolinate reductase